MFIFLIWAATN